LGARLHAAREGAALSQRELSFPGCSAAYISRIERGERVPSLQVLRELARRTGVSEAQLAYGEERLHPDVARTLRQVDEAEGTASKAERAQAYAALGRAASKVARELERG
jgi:transcriptional regulator with XRE-family HTH domain